MTKIIEKLKIIIKYSNDEIVRNDLMQHILPDLEKANEFQEEMIKELKQLRRVKLKDIKTTKEINNDIDKILGIKDKKNE
jgi:hypothetical protein